MRYTLIAAPLLALGAMSAGCVHETTMITDVRPGPHGSIIVSRCTLESSWQVFSIQTIWGNCKDNIVRAAYVEPATSSAPAAEPTK